MKKLIMCLVIISVSFGILAQAPQKMSYQAVIRNTGGALVKNQSVGMQISILQGSATGTPVYVETQTVSTNANGLIALEIGSGTPVTGTFATIDWSAGPYFIKTETDPTGGTNYIITGTSQLLSVPYALYANRSESSNDAVKLTGNQTITGNKTFTGTTTVATPVNATDAATKAYVDALIETIINELGIVRDIENNIYKIITIGSKVWMAENLKTTKYKNGTDIPLVPDNTAWLNLITPGYCWYDNNVANKDTYGALYNWYTVNTGDLCPTGWHTPSDGEWTTLENYLIANGYNYDGTTTGNKYAKALASIIGWTSSTNTGAAGNSDYPAKRNATGFTALPVGYRMGNGAFYGIGSNGSWWSATENDAADAWSRSLHYDNSGVNRNGGDKKYGFSVRCVKNN